MSKSKAASKAAVAAVATVATVATVAAVADGAGGGEASEKELFLSKWSALLHRMGKAYHVCIDSSLRQWDVSKPVMEALLHMHEELDECEPSVLADSMHIPRQTMTSLLDAMEEKQFIVRDSHPSDMRKKLIRLSAKGKKVSKTLHSELRKQNKKALALLSANDSATLVDLLTRYCEALEASMGITPKRVKH